MKSFACNLLHGLKTTASRNRDGYRHAGLKFPLSMLLCASLFIYGEAQALDVIAHRGAQAHRPENTFASEQLAQKMGADWMECDLVATKDHRLILSHDTVLEHTTNIAEAFPERKRADGHYYAIDFTLAELKTLKMRARVNDAGTRAFPDRPVDATGAYITTLEEFLTLQDGPGGFYIELKSPAWHQKSGVDTSKIALDILAKSHVPVKRVWLQCFEAKELKRLRNELKSPYLQTQLVGANAKAMLAPEGLKAIKQYADAIGPRLDSVISFTGVTPVVADAHAAGLQVHPYTLQTDVAPFMPPLTGRLIRAFEDAKVEAVFTDQADEILALRSPKAAVKKD
ncbi:glycerophosphodiester phosphodiesterase [bacterium]|nr:MAG: glycerophosphodiester phosphodiesterase [bacterium]